MEFYGMICGGFIIYFPVPTYIFNFIIYFPVPTNIFNNLLIYWHLKNQELMNYVDHFIGKGTWSSYVCRRPK